MSSDDAVSSANSETPKLNPRRITLALSLLLVLAMAADSAPQRWLRLQLFDGYQRVLPRERVSAPAVVVAIDEHSLAAYGQWPWPRTRLAEVIERIAAANPAAIGLDIIMPEPDRLSPQRIVESTPGLDPILAASIAQLSSNDMTLAGAMRGKSVVLGVAGDDSAHFTASGRPLPAVPLRFSGAAANESAGNPLERLTMFAGALRSVAEIESAAAGHGLLNDPDPRARVVHRPLVLGRVGEIPMPSLAIEMWRIALGVPALEVELDERGLSAVRVGELRVPADPDGRLWLRYGRFDIERYISAHDLLRGTANPAEMERKLVLLAVTGAALVDQKLTPLGEQVSGIEIHMQLIENLFDGSWLTRPRWALAAEMAMFLLLAILLIVLLTAQHSRRALAGFAGLLVLFATAGVWAYNAGLLFDVATPAAGGLLVYAVLLITGLSESQRQRRELASRLQAQREEAAHMRGELDAARRVQMGMLPDSPDVRAGEMRMEIKAYMEPAKTVGGDLYDFFLLDDKTLFVLIGDVSGKGLPAAIFMALVKSLCKSAALRGNRSLAEAMSNAEAEITRENPELLFVTMSVLTLNMDTGEVEYCNAGHEPPYSILDGRPGHLRLNQGGGPPLCVLPGYKFESGRYRMTPREMLCLVTDGVMDATNPQGEMYGRQRLEIALEGIASEDPATVTGTLKQVLSMFSAGTELADDQTVVVMRWNGPGTSGLITT